MNLVISIFQNPVVIGLLVLAAVVVVQSLHRIGPTEVGLVMKRFGLKKLTKDSPVAFDGEAGYQAELLMAVVRSALDTLPTSVRVGSPVLISTP